MHTLLKMLIRAAGKLFSSLLIDKKPRAFITMRFNRTYNTTLHLPTKNAVLCSMHVFGGCNL